MKAVDSGGFFNGELFYVEKLAISMAVIGLGNTSAGLLLQRSSAVNLREHHRYSQRLYRRSGP
jgi:hypothetical protein